MTARRRTTKPAPAPKPVTTVEVMDLRYERTGLYKENVPKRVGDMAKLGLTIAQMANSMGVSAPTLENWLHDKPEVRKAYEKGRWTHDHGVQLSLLQRAQGFTYVEEKHVDGVDVNGRPYSYTTRTTKRVLGDVPAQMFWLKNRDPENWKDQYRGGDTNIQVNMNKMNLDILDADEQRLLRSAAIKTLANMNGISGG